MKRGALVVALLLGPSMAPAQTYYVHCWTALQSGERALISGPVEVAGAGASQAQVVEAAWQKYRLGAALNAGRQIEDVAEVIECIEDDGRFSSVEANRALDRPR